MRDLLVTAVIFSLLPLCFLRPWMGVLVWSWIGYMNPHRLCWGFAAEFPFAEIVAIAILAGLPFCRDMQALPRRREVYLILALWLVFFLSTVTGAIHPADAWMQLGKVSKIFAMTFVTLLLFQDMRRVRLLIWVIALSIGFFGIKGGIWTLATGGHDQVLGPEGTFLGSNTHLGVALNMVLPMLVLLRRDSTRPWVRHFLLLASGCTAIAIVGTYSRGAFLGLIAVSVFLLLKSRGRLVALVTLLMFCLLVTAAVPEKWFNRVETIETYQQDESANSRFQSWYVSYRLALDHPFLGAGFRPFSSEIYEHYIPGYWDRGHDAHSIVFQVLAEHGFTGLTLYLSLIISTLLSLRRIREAARKRDNPQIENYASMLEVGIMGYLVDGSFNSLSYFDLFYHFIAITVILWGLVSREVVAVGMQQVEDGRGLQGADSRPIGVRVAAASASHLAAGPRKVRV